MGNIISFDTDDDYIRCSIILDVTIKSIFEIFNLELENLFENKKFFKNTMNFEITYDNFLKVRILCF